MKKLLALTLTLAMIFTFAACGEKQTVTTGGEEMFTIGIMQFGEFTALQNAKDGFIAGLKEAGIEEGKNLKVVYKSADGDVANCPAIADNLINAGSDLIFAIATPSVSCIKEKTTDIPVLFTAVTDPVASGLIADAKKPGANITGTSDMNPVAEQIDLLKELLPDAKTVAVMYTSSESNSAAQFALAKAQIEKLGMTCKDASIASIEDVQLMINSLKGNVDAIYIPTDNTLSDGMTTVAQFANEAGLPTIVGEPGQVQNGGTATFGIDYVELGKQTAKMAAEVLRSSNPLIATANMAIGFQTEGCETAINQASIDALGLTVPASILDRATKY